MSGAAKSENPGYGRQLFIVLILVGAVILLHAFAAPRGVDPTAMLALGFIILASYTIGELGGAIRLPHVTGYLVAGFMFGPSVAHILPEIVRFPPLDEGILNEEVISSLVALDTLAVALIALMAGGELKLAALRRDARLVSAIIGSQIVFIFVLVTALMMLVGGIIPAITLPGLGQIPLLGTFTLALVVASISAATSPAVTIAVITSLGAKGPMTRTVLMSVVLKDVVDVCLFSILSMFAATVLGMSVSDQSLGMFLLIHVGGSLIVGAILGGLLSLYLRYIGREIPLVVVGLVYSASLLATELHLDPLLLFLATGFTVSNFSKAGDTLIATVEKLSMPVYVVFFTLAGAKLHLDDVIAVFPFAIALVVTRATAMRFGITFGARLGRAPEATQKYAWMGFISQAGVSISLAMIVGNSFGEVGRSIQTLVIAGVAFNEVIGPILLKTGLGLAREIPSKDGHDPEQESATKSEAELDERAFTEWPEREEGDPWGDPPSTKSPKLNQEIRDLRADLFVVVDDVSTTALARHHEDAEAYVRDLKREFLRHHRRLTVRTRTHETHAELLELLHAEESSLAERWRAIVLARAERLSEKSWSPASVVEVIDHVVESVPEHVKAPFEDESFEAQPEQGPLRASWRAWLRMRRAIARLFRRDVAPRDVELRALARYHLSGVAPTELEKIAALLVSADLHLAARTRSLFDGILRGHEALVAAGDAPLEERLKQVRVDVEEELAVASLETERFAKEGRARTAAVLGSALRAITAESRTYGTPDLPTGKRRSSRIFRDRIKALDTLNQKADAVQKTVAAVCSLLGLELELVGLEARVKDALEAHVSGLEADVRGRARVQAERMEQALSEAKTTIETALDDPERTGEELATLLRAVIESLERIANEAGRSTQQLREQLSDERTCAPLLDAVRRATQTLGDRYDAPEGRLEPTDDHLPTPVPVMNVPFRDLVTAHVEATVAPKLLEATRAMAERVEPLVSSLAEIERLVAFNAELANSELDVVNEPVPEVTRGVLREVVVGALDRSREVIAGHVTESSTWPEMLGAQIRDAVLGSVVELRGHLVDGELTRDRLDVLRRRAASRRLMRSAETLPSLLARARVIAASTFVGLVGTERLEVFRRKLGLVAPETEKIPNAEVFQRPEPTAAIPLVYRRLFAAETVEAADVLTARETTIGRAKRILLERKPGRLRSVALVGHDGVGKGALMAAIVRARGDRGVRRIRLDEPATLAAVDAWFEEPKEGQLIALTGFHWLVSMRAGGLDPLRRFVEGVIEDGGRNAWLVAADSLVWRVACQAAPLTEAYPEVITVDPLDTSELEAAILARHGLSGYSLNFESRAERTRLDELFAEGAGRIRRPYESFFQSIHAASGGRVRDALRLWIAAIDEVNETSDLVHIGKVPESPHAAIRQLPEAILLMLYQVARQGWMDAAVQAAVFRVDEVTAEAQLARLAHLGLLEPREHDTYRIPSHLREAVNRALLEKGWIR